MISALRFFCGWLHWQKHLCSSSALIVSCLHTLFCLSPFPATFTWIGYISFWVQSCRVLFQCLLCSAQRWAPGREGGSWALSGILAACLQSTLRNSDESSCCYILFSLLPWGSGNYMFVFLPFWFMFPFVGVFLTDPPDWVPDEVCSYCTACKAPFTVIRRKHHCRSCGKVMTQSNMWETICQREQQIYA